MSDAPAWAGVAVAAVGVGVSGYFAWDARRQAKQARHDADEAIAVQLRDEQRRNADADLQREADAVLAAAKTGWRSQWNECWRIETVHHVQQVDIRRFAVQRLAGGGIIVKREQPTREDVVVRLSNHDSVARAHAQHDGYRVVLKFDPDDPGSVM